MQNINRLLTVLLLVSVLSVTEAFGQIRDRVVKPQPKPPTTTTTAPKPKPSKKPAASTRLPQPVQDLESSMIYVEGGSFTMGAKQEWDSDEEKPAHRVTLSSFSICKYEVTQELWEAVMGSNPSHIKGSKYPVDMVIWEECQQFIMKLNQLTGKQYRLPTEAEWEYAARGGNRSLGFKCAGRNNQDDVAWDSGRDRTLHDVGTKRANELGLYDMSGNVMELCNDWYGSYSSGSQTNPCGPSSGTYRVVRGPAFSLTCRINLKPTVPNNNVGLRLAL